MSCVNAIFFSISTGKGTQAPNIKDKYCACHLVSSRSAFGLM